jgi:hypothetical protein
MKKLLLTISLLFFVFLSMAQNKGNRAIDTFKVSFTYFNGKDSVNVDGFIVKIKQIGKSEFGTVDKWIFYDDKMKLITAPANKVTIRK